MRLAAFLLFAVCGSAPTPWHVPDGWKHERIPFPLDFAAVAFAQGCRGASFRARVLRRRTRLATGRTRSCGGSRTVRRFDANTVAGELTTYFRGLVDAVDEKHEITDRDSIVVHATPQGDGSRSRHTYRSVHDEAGRRARRCQRPTIKCSSGVLWVFVIAPAESPLRSRASMRSQHRRPAINLLANK